MKFTNEQAMSLGLKVGGSAGTALVNQTFDFEGRRLYIDRAPRKVKREVDGKEVEMTTPVIHLSGFTPEECEMLGATPNPANEFSSRITGFLPLSEENLAAAAKVVRDATSPAYEKAREKGVVAGVDVGSVISAAAAELATQPDPTPAE